jgi:hypothetical protein
VDVGAVNQTAEVSATQAQALASQVAVSAETLRAQVAAAAGLPQVTADGGIEKLPLLRPT